MKFKLNTFEVIDFMAEGSTHFSTHLYLCISHSNACPPIQRCFYLWVSSFDNLDAEKVSFISDGCIVLAAYSNPLIYKTILAVLEMGSQETKLLSEAADWLDSHFGMGGNPCHKDSWLDRQPLYDKNDSIQSIDFADKEALSALNHNDCSIELSVIYKNAITGQQKIRHIRAITFTWLAKKLHQDGAFYVHNTVIVPTLDLDCIEKSLNI
jgi:hypothetical protein